jgi:hypothetical protein
MAINLAEILQVLSLIEKLGGELINAWSDLQAHAAQEADAKKREKLLEACSNHDAAAVRAIWFGVGQ